MSWNIDPNHAQVTFSARHMMIMNVRGQFEDFTGTVHFDEQTPSNSSVDVRIQAGSINTNDSQRDEHLKSPDFLNVEQYPYLTFSCKRIETVDDNHGRIVGDLTIKDVTKEVVLETEYHGQATSPWGTTQAGFNAHTKISRKDWELTWNVPLETGGVLVGDEVDINIEIELIKQPEAETEAASA